MGMIGQPSILGHDIGPIGLDDMQVGVIKEAHDPVPTTHKNLVTSFVSFLNASWKTSLLDGLSQKNSRHRKRANKS